MTGSFITNGQNHTYSYQWSVSQVLKDGSLKALSLSYFELKNKGTLGIRSNYTESLSSETTLQIKVAVTVDKKLSLTNATTVKIVNEQLNEITNISSSY